MRTIALAGTSLCTSRLGFGLSGLHHVLRSNQRQRMLSAAYDCGIRYFDTSPYYGHGLAERELGAFGYGRRSQILIAAKFGIQPDPWLSRFPLLMYARLGANAALRRFADHGATRQPRRDYSSRNATRSLDRSLCALRTDYVDILYLHEPTFDQLIEPEQTIDTLKALQASGRVRYFGLSGNAAECVRIARQYPPLGALIQVDAAPGREEFDVLKEAGIPFHSSFGHFRNKTGSMEALLASAAASNADGVILFSTRRTERVRAMARLLASQESS